MTPNHPTSDTIQYRYPGGMTRVGYTQSSVTIGLPYNEQVRQRKPAVGACIEGHFTDSPSDHHWGDGMAQLVERRPQDPMDFHDPRFEPRFPSHLLSMFPIPVCMHTTDRCVKKTRRRFAHRGSRFCHHRSTIQTDRCVKTTRRLFAH